MTWLEALVSIAVSVIGMVGLVIPVYLKLRDPAGSADRVSSRDLEEARDPDGEALRAVYRMEARLSRVEESNEKLAIENAKLGAENRVFRSVILGVIDRLEAVSEWMQAGHKPPAPHLPDSIIEWIRASIPGLGRTTNDE